MLSKFIENGYTANELIDNVILVENFLTKEEIDVFINLAISTNEDGWRQEYLNNLKQFCMKKFGRDDVDNLVKEGKFEITSNWDDKIISTNSLEESRTITKRLIDILDTTELVVPGFGSIQRQYEGVPLKSHTDQHTDPSIEYASIIYLNDNYNGGEFYFVNKNFEIKPKPGSLLIFPGTQEFEHGVKEPLAGPVRYVLPGFIHTKDFYEKNKY
jgi:uncharacterized protein YeeX (DUF496 family)